MLCRKSEMKSKDELSCWKDYERSLQMESKLLGNPLPYSNGELLCTLFYKQLKASLISFSPFWLLFFWLQPSDSSSALVERLIGWKRISECSCHIGSQWSTVHVFKVMLCWFHPSLSLPSSIFDFSMLLFWWAAGYVLTSWRCLIWRLQSLLNGELD